MLLVCMLLTAWRCSGFISNLCYRSSVKSRAATDSKFGRSKLSTQVLSYGLRLHSSHDNVEYIDGYAGYDDDDDAEGEDGIDSSPARKQRQNE